MPIGDDVGTSGDAEAGAGTGVAVWGEAQHPHRDGVHRSGEGVGARPGRKAEQHQPQPGRTTIVKGPNEGLNDMLHYLYRIIYVVMI